MGTDVKEAFAFMFSPVHISSSLGFRHEILENKFNVFRNLL